MSASPPPMSCRPSTPSKYKARSAFLNVPGLSSTSCVLERVAANSADVYGVVHVDSEVVSCTQGDHEVRCTTACFPLADRSSTTSPAGASSKLNSKIIASNAGWNGYAVSS